MRLSVRGMYRYWQKNDFVKFPLGKGSYLIDIPDGSKSDQMLSLIHNQYAGAVDLQRGLHPIFLEYDGCIDHTPGVKDGCDVIIHYLLH